jgi:hypothetical protein
VADKSELQHLPDFNGSLAVAKEVRSSLIARGRSDASTLLARRTEPVYLARVKAKGKWGLIDRDGTFVCEPIYQELHGFYEGIAAFADTNVGSTSWQGLYDRNGADWNGLLFAPERSNRILGLGSWGYIDSTGRPIATDRFELVRNFSEGLAGVRLNGKWGFVNSNGALVIEPRFDGVRDFRNGLCVVMFGARCGLIDTGGRFVIEPRFYYLREHLEGLACAAMDRGSYGYIDSSGSYTIKPQFSHATDFHCGLAAASIEGQRGYINTQGNFIYSYLESPDFGRALGRFCDGVAFVMTMRRPKPGTDTEYEPGDSAFLNVNGRSILEGRDHLLIPCRPFSDGLGLVKLRPAENRDEAHKDQYGFVDTNGTMAIFPQFLKACPFSNGRAAVLVDGLGRRLIDAGGNIVGDRLPGKGDYSDLVIFSEGYARLWADGKAGFIDLNGRVSVEPRFTYAQQFRNGFALVGTQGGSGYEYIDTAGIVGIPCLFEQAEAFEQVVS